MARERTYYEDTRLASWKNLLNPRLKDDVSDTGHVTNHLGDIASERCRR